MRRSGPRRATRFRYAARPSHIVHVLQRQLRLVHAELLRGRDAQLLERRADLLRRGEGWSDSSTTFIKAATSCQMALTGGPWQNGVGRWVAKSQGTGPANFIDTHIQLNQIKL